MRRAVLCLIMLGFFLPTLVFAFTFTHTLTVGSQGTEVSSLQQLLKDQHFFTYPIITGVYGAATWKAVAAFQLDHALAGVGYVGPQTRTLLNGLLQSTGTVTITPPAPIAAPPASSSPLTALPFPPIYSTPPAAPTSSLDPWFAPSGGSGAGAASSDSSTQSVISTGPLISMNFLTGTYTVAGASVNINSLIEDRYGSDPDITVDIDAGGLFEGNETAQAKGSLLTQMADINGGITVVMDFINDSTLAKLLFIYNAAESKEIALYLNVGNGAIRIEYNDGSGSVAQDTNNTITIGQPMRVAFTYDGTKLSASLNGGAVVTLASQLVFSVDHIFIANRDSGSPVQHLRAMQVYAARPDSDLPALSTP